MFVDSSALVAMLGSEPEGERLAAKLNAGVDNETSAIVMYETVLGLRRKFDAPLGEILRNTLAFLAQGRVSIRDMPAETYLLALDTFEKYGKGSGHSAKLNMGDCFSYAMAKQAGVPLLYKGDDFAQTDLA